MAMALRFTRYSCKILKERQQLFNEPIVQGIAANVLLSMSLSDVPLICATIFLP